MPSGWYLKVADKEVGPLSPKQLQVMAKRGQLEPEDLVRRGTIGKWVPARRVKGIFPEETSQPQAAESSQPQAAEESSQETQTDPPPSDTSQPPQPEPAAGQPNTTSEPFTAPAPQQPAPAPNPTTQQPAPPVVAQNASIPQAQIPVAEPVTQIPRQPMAPSVAPVASDTPQPFEITTDESPVARATGRRRRAGSSKRKRRNRLVTIVLLVFAVVAVAGVGVGLMFWERPIETPESSEKNATESPQEESTKEAPAKKIDISLSDEAIDSAISKSKTKPINSQTSNERSDAENKEPGESENKEPGDAENKEPGDAENKEPGEPENKEPVEIETPEDDGGPIAIPGVGMGVGEQGVENRGFEDDPEFMKRGDDIRAQREAGEEAKKAGGRIPQPRDR